MLVFLSGFALLLGGVALGVWFGQHYQIVPRAAVPAPPTPPVEVAQARPATAIPPPPPPPTKKDTPKSLLKRGNQRDYQIKAAITGSGLEQEANPLDVALDFNSSFQLAVKSVDSRGNSDMELAFGDTFLQGEFMGSPVSFAKTAQGVTYQMDGMTPEDASAPQIAFFNTPIRMRVTPEGQVSSAQGLEGFEKVLTSISPLARPQLSDTAGDTETQWITDFSIPIPGLPVAPAAQAINTVVGYEELDGRPCAAVSQELRSNMKESPLGAVGGFLGQFAGLSMPKFKIEGHNMLYYEVATGQLYRANLDFKLGLEIAQSMKDAAQLMGSLGDALKEVAGGEVPPGAPTDAGQPLDLGVSVKADLGLVSETTLEDQPAAPEQP